MTRDELVELLVVERFAPLQSPPLAIHHTPLVRAEVVADVIDLANRRRQRESRHRVQRGRIVVRRRVG